MVFLVMKNKCSKSCLWPFSGIRTPENLIKSEMDKLEGVTGDFFWFPDLESNWKLDGWDIIHVIFMLITCFCLIYQSIKWLKPIQLADVQGCQNISPKQYSLQVCGLSTNF